MKTTSESLKYIRPLAIAVVFILAGSSCSSSPAISAGKPVIRTMQVTQLVTVPVTQEVTRVVEVPVTVTPDYSGNSTPTLGPAIDTTATLTLTPATPQVTILEHSDCLYGPGSGYLYKYSVFPDDIKEVVGRNMDGTWLYIQAVDGWNPCWIQAASVKFISSDGNAVPIVFSKLPYSNQYMPPDASAHRDGTVVTISWKAVWMSLDDYRGYLIEAWLCRGGVQVFDPITYIPPLANNTGTLSIQVTDDPGCSLPSSARIYSAVKQGYSNWSNIAWPGY